MGRTIHPTSHQPSGREPTVGDVFAGAKVAILLSFDSLDHGRAIAPLVRHLAVSGHVLGVHFGGGLELAADRQWRQLGVSPNAVMRFNHFGTQGGEINVGSRFLNSR